MNLLDIECHILSQVQHFIVMHSSVSLTIPGFFQNLSVCLPFLQENNKYSLTMPKKNKIILCFWREIWSICRPLASWTTMLPGTPWAWICAQRLFLTIKWMAQNIDQCFFVLLCFAVGRFGVLFCFVFLNWFQSAKRHNLVSKHPAVKKQKYIKTLIWRMVRRLVVRRIL